MKGISAVKSFTLCLRNKVSYSIKSAVFKMKESHCTVFPHSDWLPRRGYDSWKLEFTWSFTGARKKRNLLIMSQNHCRNLRSQKQAQVFFKVKMRYEKPLTLPSTRKQQNHNGFAKKIGEETKESRKVKFSSRRSSVSILTYIGRRNANITSPSSNKSTAIVRHSFWVYRPCIP